MTRKRTPGKISEQQGNRDYVRIATDYCRDVVAGRIGAGELIRAACRRQLDDLERAKKDKEWEFRFDPERAARVCRFIERLPHIKGDLAKQKALIRLEGWQSFILTTTFGWVRKKDNTRRFRRVYLEVGRKNAKSTLSSGVALYLLAADGEEGAEVYALATTKAQAGIVWHDAAAMVRKSPGLRARFGLETWAAAISIPSRSATFQPLPGDPGDGTNPHCAVVDEYHEHKSPAAYDAMYSGMGARSQPLMWTITTAGYNRAGPCFQLRAYARKMLQGRVRDESLFAAVYTLDDADDWTDPRNWVKANPNLGVSVSRDQLLEACQEAQNNPAKQVNFLTKRMNVWLNAGTAWMDMRKWDQAADPSLVLENFAGHRAWIGLDLASKIDLADLEILVEVEPGRYAVFGKHYLPRATVEANAEGTHSHYAGWEVDGWVTLTEGTITDYSVIRDDLREVCKLLDVQAVAYDPFQATQLAGEMMGEGLPMVEVAQQVRNMSEPMKQVQAWVYSGQLRHDGDPCTAWAMSNVVAHLDNKDNIYPRKETPDNKIDPAVALIMAANRAMSDESPPPPSPWDISDHELAVI